MTNPDINKRLMDYVYNPLNPDNNYLLAQEYDKIGHITSAYSFYLRSAELSINDLKSYESLLHCALCIEKNGNRPHSHKGLLLRGISLLPRRPEAYLLLAKAYHLYNDWHECYNIACIGEKIAEDNKSEIISGVGYAGDFAITFERMVSAWNIGLQDESISLMRKLLLRKDLTPEYLAIVQDNLNRYGRSYKKATHYDENLYPLLKNKFPGSETIKDNHSQCYQDMFVLTMLEGKRNGFFIEIGCDDAYFNSNTALLEKQFGWNGISIDIEQWKIDKFAPQRKSVAICMDAMKIDFNVLLTRKSYDYLQVDCEPAATSLKILQRIPFEKHKFAVITFEHDNYCDNNKTVKTQAKQFLESHGYVQVVNNISEDHWSDFEDWYVHPDLVSKKMIDRMRSISDDIKKVDHYMLNR